MRLTQAKFVMHHVIPSTTGPLVSRKPPGAGALEQAIRQAPGGMQGSLGHPGKRFAVACGAVRQFSAQHRGSTELVIVNCPKCRAIAEKANAKAGR